MGTGMDIDGFKAHLVKKERSENTISTYVRSVATFFDMYAELTEENILSYKQFLVKTHKPKTVNVKLCGILGYCKFKGVITEITGIRIQKTLSVENVITKDEYEQLLACLKADGNMHHYWLVVYLANTGARASEFVRLTIPGLDRGFDEMFTKGKMR